jgi:catechol 2,3-dioxygenase-like lactoylglutathione lyase family enzyme
MIWYLDFKPLRLESIDHVQVTVPPSALAEALRFYSVVLGLEPIAKPEALAPNGGAWYRLGAVELHLSREEAVSLAGASKRHVCYVVSDLEEARLELVRQAVEIIPDRQPIPGWARFYIWDPGGNRIEIAQRLEQGPGLAQASEGIIRAERP